MPQVSVSLLHRIIRSNLDTYNPDRAGPTTRSNVPVTLAEARLGPVVCGLGGDGKESGYKERAEDHGVETLEDDGDVAKGSRALRKRGSKERRGITRTREEPIPQLSQILYRCAGIWALTGLRRAR